MNVSVYQYHDAMGRLIYVGITSRGKRRQHEHASTKEWWPLVTGCTIEHYADRDSASVREIELVKRHSPPYNTIYNSDKAAALESYTPIPVAHGKRKMPSPLNGGKKVSARILARRAWYEMPPAEQRLAPCTACGEPWSEWANPRPRNGPECENCRQRSTRQLERYEQAIQMLYTHPTTLHKCA